MTDTRSTFGDIAKEMLGMYASILGDSSFNKVRRSGNVTARRLRFLKDFASGNVDLRRLSTADAISFFDALLDCLALQIATGVKRSVFQALALGDRALLGPASIRRALLEISDDAVADWCFQLLIHASISCKGFGPVRDLRADPRFKRQNRKVCEFILPDKEGRVELVECKRIHPGGGGPLLSMRKIGDKIAEAAGQLAETRKIVDGVDGHVTCKHVLLDLTAYQSELRPSNPNLAGVSVVGFHEEEVKQQLTQTAAVSSTEDVDKVSLCWRNLVYIDDKPRAIVHRSTSTLVREGATSLFDYEGWTIVGYPMRQLPYAEFRVSTRARSAAYIRTEYNACTSPTFLWGSGDSIPNS
jgi:hypothetical protein